MGEPFIVTKVSNVYWFTLFICLCVLPFMGNCTANKKSTEKAAKNIQTGNIFKQSTVSTNFLINLHKNPIL